ncbi:MAG: hypothetical protein JWM68_4788, partial [Verrucomicrobiales bacterium]|nr:hypothetical protein [Verrucomicrobiales bacterium]
MKQLKITSIAGLINQGGVLVGAATSIGAILGLHHNDKDKLNADLTDLIMAVGGHEQAKAELYDRRTGLKVTATNTCNHLRKGRDILKPVFGYSYSNVWTLLGYNDSLGVTDRPEDQQVLLQALRTYYMNHPTFEVPLLNLTAAYTETVIQTLTTAQTAVAAQEGAVEATRNVRDEKANQLRTRFSMLNDELSQLMGPLDPRWLTFGLNMPGADETPDKVEGVQVTIIGPTAAAVKWGASARAQYYRIYKRVIGVDADYVAVGSPADLDFTIENLPAGSMVDVIVTAVNNGGEGARSEV